MHKHGQSANNTRRLSRRDFLLQLGGLGIASVAAYGKTAPFLAMADEHSRSSQPASTLATFSPGEDQLLEELEKLNFKYFWEQTSPLTGLTKDRCNVLINDTSVVASIAATGFGLTALCIGQQRGYVSLHDARERALATLRFLWKKMPTHRGFFYHFADLNTGERMWDSEVSSVDTAILLCGILSCRQHFPEHSEISLLAYEIFDRVDWTWLSEDTSLLPHGWTPEGGFLPYRWDFYSELMMMYLLGLGSLTHPLSVETWNAWKRTRFEFDGISYIGSFAPLFVHQYSQAWFDFRGKCDKYADYFQNSVAATEAHRCFCLELAKQFPDYSDDLWGITASDSQHGYVIWGGPPAIGPIDGTVVPSASAGSLPFLPQPVMRVLMNIKEHYGRAWSKYGFVNAFNPLTNWYDHDVIGIDLGITMLMAENARTGFVWKTFMKNPEAKRGMERAVFKKYQPSASVVNTAAACPSATLFQ
ncbi:MAG: glucoamylase family protein [Terriglobales bacterium]